MEKQNQIKECEYCEEEKCPLHKEKCPDCLKAGGYYLKTETYKKKNKKTGLRTIYKCPGEGKFHTPESRQAWIVPDDWI